MKLKLPPLPFHVPGVELDIPSIPTIQLPSIDPPEFTMPDSKVTLKRENPFPLEEVTHAQAEVIKLYSIIRAQGKGMLRLSRRLKRERAIHEETVLELQAAHKHISYLQEKLLRTQADIVKQQG